MGLLNSKEINLDGILKRKNLVFLGAGASGLIILLIYFHYKKKKNEEERRLITQEGLEGLEVLKKAIQEKFPNVAFYKNEIPSAPNGEYIENILTVWKGDYDLLEKNHSYIQWLFPNKTQGTNPQSHPLLDEEAKMIREDPILKQRVKKAFEMMLDFYGMKLTDENKFVLAKNATERLQVLNQWGNHNFLRITRILSSLKELGHAKLMAPWMKFLADLIYLEEMLDQATTSYENYWLNTLDAEDKIEVTNYTKIKV